MRAAGSSSRVRPPTSSPPARPSPASTSPPTSRLDSPPAGDSMLPVVGTLLSIGDFSRMTFLSVKALRHYHEVGLLPPAEIDPETGYRRYDAAQVPTAQVIRRLRELDMSLDEVRRVIEASDVGARNEAISAHLRRMEGELEQTRETVRSLRLLLDETAPAPVAISYRVDEASRALAIRDEIAHDDM